MYLSWLYFAPNLLCLWQLVKFPQTSMNIMISSTQVITIQSLKALNGTADEKKPNIKSDSGLRWVWKCINSLYWIDPTVTENITYLNVSIDTSTIQNLRSSILRNTTFTVTFPAPLRPWKQIKVIKIGMDYPHNIEITALQSLKVLHLKETEGEWTDL